jgi:hypothetical protein
MEMRLKTSSFGMFPNPQQLQAKDPGLLVPAGGDTTEFYPNRVLYDEYDRRVLKDFFKSDGSIRQLPMQRKKFGAVLKHRPSFHVA